MKTTDRDRQLADEFNGFWKQCLGRDEDYYSRLTLDGFVRLKRALGNINNIVTLKTTLSFIDCLLAEKIVLLPQAAEMRRRVKETSANANGFDVCYSGGPDGLPLIAEVKCNIPVKKDRFGAAQEAGIRKDIEALLQGKRKMGVTDVSGYYKFMAVLDMAEADMGLQRRALGLRRAVRLINYGISLRESLLDIADAAMRPGCYIVPYVPVERELVNDLTVPFIRIPVVLIKIFRSAGNV